MNWTNAATHLETIQELRESKGADRAGYRVHACNHSPRESEAGGCSLQDQPVLYSSALSQNAKSRGYRAQCYECLPSTHKVLGSVLSRVRKEQWRLYRQYLLACLFFQDRVSPVVAYAFNISTQEAETCRFLSLSRLGVQSYTGKLLMFVNRGIMEHWGKNRLLKFARTVRHVAQMVLHLPDMHEFSSQYPVQSGVDHMSVIVVSGSRAEWSHVQGHPQLHSRFKVSSGTGDLISKTSFS